MSYIRTVLYSVQCDVCEAIADEVIAEDRNHALAYVRRELRKEGWGYRNGKDLCPQHNGPGGA